MLFRSGHDREFAAALIFPNLALCRALCPDLDPEASVATVLADARVRAKFQTLVHDLARQSTGSSTFVARALLLEDPPSMDAREITDKGSLNQRAVLQHRSALVDELYAPAPSPRVIVASMPGDETA